MLNLPGHHGTAAIVAEITENRYGNYASIVISDCDRRISLEFELTDGDSYENDMHKVDTLVDALQTFRRALKKLHAKPDASA